MSIFSLTDGDHTAVRHNDKGIYTLEPITAKIGEKSFRGIASTGPSFDKQKPSSDTGDCKPVLPHGISHTVALSKPRLRSRVVEATRTLLEFRVVEATRNASSPRCRSHAERFYTTALGVLSGSDGPNVRGYRSATEREFLSTERNEHKVTFTPKALYF